MMLRVGVDFEHVKSQITSRTRAIIAIILFGHPAGLADLKALADQHGLYLIEDNAQAPLGSENGKLCGTIGHIGVFILNYHKHIHTGEGGTCVTNDDDLALRLQLVRNQGENLVTAEGINDISNLIGMNLRITEMSAAIGLVQID
ncbi:DegT/DnrJ/EryC1/StrS family aminotransferase [Gammaproteobacteria bacterium]|nr:DegT/DnrJ/EryC1/StrS family aminotransferase [Gammaproteobacteria bacterium]